MHLFTNKWSGGGEVGGLPSVIRYNGILATSFKDQYPHLMRPSMLVEAMLHSCALWWFFHLKDTDLLGYYIKPLINDLHSCNGENTFKAMSCLNLALITFIIHIHSHVILYNFKDFSANDFILISCMAILLCNCLLITDWATLVNQMYITLRQFCKRNY